MKLKPPIVLMLCTWFVLAALTVACQPGSPPIDTANEAAAAHADPNGSNPAFLWELRVQECFE